MAIDVILPALGIGGQGAVGQPIHQFAALLERRRGAGPRWWRRRMLRTEVAEMTRRSLAHSPLMRRYPQRGFSLPRRSTVSTTLASRPGRWLPLRG